MEINLNLIIEKIKRKQYVCRQELVQYLLESKENLSAESVNWLVYDMQKTGKIKRIQRNLYTIGDMVTNKKIYYHHASERAETVREILLKNYENLDFVLWETWQLNEFVNQQLGDNYIIVEVDKMVDEMVFETLKKTLNNPVLYKPDKVSFYRYTEDGAVIVIGLTTEIPRNPKDIHALAIEKLLVDAIGCRYISYLIQQSDLKNIYEDAFEKYDIREKTMFRYSKRRRNYQKVHDLIAQLGIQLITEEKIDNEELIYRRTCQICSKKMR